MGGMNKKSNDKNIIVSFSLLMRLFEFMHEDAANDVDMHKVMEKLVAFSDGVNPLTMDVYDCLIADVKPQETSEYATEEDMETSYNIGNCCANVCCGMDDINYRDAGAIITDIKDDGYGASNAEIDNFWKGYCALNPECIYDSSEECEEEPSYDAEINEIIKLGRI